MRASATSKISSAANYAAVQAKPNATKTDEASPFALLVGSIAPKDTGRDANQSPVKDAGKDASNSADKSADDKSARAADNQDATAQTASPASSQPARAGKSDKAKDDVPPKASNKTDGDDQTTAADLQAQDQQAAQQALIPPAEQNLPPTPPAVQAAAAAASENDSDDLAIDAAASTGIKPQTDVKLPAGNKLETKPGINADAPTGTPAKMPPKPAITAQTPAPTDDSGDDTSDTQIAEPAAQAAVKMAAPLPAQNAPDTQTAPAAGSQSGVAQNSGVTNTDAAPQTTAQLPRDAAAQANAAKTDTTDPVPASEGNSEGKSPALKNTTSKTRTVQADVASKPANSDVPKSDAPKTTEPQLDTVTAASAPKAAPQPAPHDVFAVNAIAAPQAPSSPVATATANAHVHVSAEASPDLPSLAVAIAGKSQSGAKQFDIRLDPPELGRVEVRLSIDATGKASAHLSADQPQTLSLLQKDAPVLTRALRDAGLDVSQDGLNFSLRQQAENQNGNAGNNGRRGSSRAFALNASISIDATAGSAAYRAAANGRLDIRV